MKGKRSLALLALLGALVPAPGHALDEVIGRALFKRAWVPAPSSTTSNDGLGPLFNARSCSACHQGLDRARVDTDAGVVRSEHLVLRLSDKAGAADPVYGRQLQTSATAGVEPEGRIEISHDGYRARDLSYGPLAAGTHTGALVAPALRGLGRLAAVPEEEIVASTERLAHNPDGVRGRVNWVTDASGNRRVGRFGWKASQPSLQAQVELAFLLDLGLSTGGRQASGDCTIAQSACVAAPHGNGPKTPEIADEISQRVTTYLASIEPVAPHTSDPKGLGLFETTGCGACHRPVLPSAAGPVAAFTDLLLHDLGAANGSGATEPGVAPTEWRTAPLWGLSRLIGKGAGLMHDGRAETIDKAVELHGGEAIRSRQRFEALSKPERERLVAFLRAL